MHWDVEVLSRVQFALTVMFHYLFPPLTIGLGGLLVFMEAMYLKTGDLHYEAMTKFWTKIFALNFAMGVASGIVMEFEFGTNWASYSRYVGDIFGSALAAEGIFAFFLESGFLAVLVFGWDRVSARMHFFSTIMVALGALFSSIWIVVANSWQQTPAGYQILHGRAEITDFWAMVFNPSSMPRLVHTVIGGYVLGAFFVMSVSAFYHLKGRYQEFAKKSFTVALITAVVMTIAAALSGDFEGKNVAQHQPAKLAAMEAHFTTGDGASPLYLFGIPNEGEQRVDYGVAVPGMLSFLAHGNFHEPVKGLDKTPRDEWPPVWPTFATFHVMVATGVIMLLLALLAAYFGWRGTLFQKRWLLWVFVFAVPLPYLANQLGWCTAELGRQPWVVYGKMRTSEAWSKAISSNQVTGSIIMFLLIYALLFAVWIYVLDHKIRHGPEDLEPTPALTPPGALVGLAGLRAGTGGPSLTEESAADRKQTNSKTQ